jgi:hypothetical protein
MKTPTRKSLGAVVLVISLLLALVLYASGAPLLTSPESHTYSSSDGSVTVAHFEIHWQLLAVFASASLGLVAFVWPQTKPRRFEP